MLIVSQIETQLGSMTACSTGDGICMLSFGNIASREKDLMFLSKSFKDTVTEGENGHLRLLRKELEEYFSGTRKEFSVKLVPPGTVFQRSVWQELLKIDYGSTHSYRQQSEVLGIPGSVRAVANANGMNRIAILIPCHRVVGSDGKLTGYAGGLERKKWLLNHEKKFSGHTLF